MQYPSSLVVSESDAGVKRNRVKMRETNVTLGQTMSLWRVSLNNHHYIDGWLLQYCSRKHLGNDVEGKGNALKRYSMHTTTRQPVLGPGACRNLKCL